MNTGHRIDRRLTELSFRYNSIESNVCSVYYLFTKILSNLMLNIAENLCARKETLSLFFVGANSETCLLSDSRHSGSSCLCKRCDDEQKHNSMNNKLVPESLIRLKDFQTHF